MDMLDFNLQRVKFHDNIDQNAIFTIQVQNIRQKINRDQLPFFGDNVWRISIYQYQLLKKLNFFKLVKQINIDVLRVGNLHFGSIIQDINDISFKNLSALYLSQNKIASLQYLQNLEMPNLKLLCLSSNYLTSMNSFRKINAPRIGLIDLSDNNLIEINFLEQLNTPILQTLNIQYQGSSIRCQNLSPSMKFQSVILTYFRIQSCYRKSLVPKCLKLIPSKFSKFYRKNQIQNMFLN